MVRQRQKDSNNKRSAVLAAVEAMERTRSPITVAEVARRAGVSTWLVRQEPLLEVVRNAQTRHSIAPTSQDAANSSTGSLRVERDLLRQENQRLRHDLQRHQRRISELLGDQIDGTDAHSQSLRIRDLTDQNTILSRQASAATQELLQLQ